MSSIKLKTIQWSFFKLVHVVKPNQLKNSIIIYNSNVIPANFLILIILQKNYSIETYI